MPQASRTMRLISVMLAAIAALITARAQTNYSSMVDFSSVTNSGSIDRSLSLGDCIQLALRNNLDLQIDRYNPAIQLYVLKAVYGDYDPSLSFAGEHDHSEAGSQILGGGFTIPGSTSDANKFTAGLGPGLTPWGMTYALTGNANDTWGNDFRSGTNILGTNILIPRPFESTIASTSLKLTQPLLKNFWIDSTRMNIRINKNRLKWSDLELRLNTMQTVTTLEQAYYDLIYNRENVVVQQKAVELAEKLAAENRKRVEVGQMAPLEARQAESQAATTRADLIAAQSSLAVQENTVKQLITANYSEWANVTPVPSENLLSPKREFSLQDSWRKGLTQRPEILQAKLDVEKAGIQLKFDYNQLYPQLDLFATYGYNGGGSGQEFSGAFYEIQQRSRPIWSYGGSISVPLANTAARNNYKGSKVTLQQATLTVKRWERDIMKQIDDDIKLAQSGFERVGATRAAREYAEEALVAEQKKLEQGKSTTYTVLQMQRDLTTARGNEIQALSTYNKNLSQLSFDEGSTFQRLGINMEVK
jgi:outer membrane protein